MEIHRTMTPRMPPGKGSVSRPMITSSATSRAKTASKNGPDELRCSIVRGGWLAVFAWRLVGRLAESQRKRARFARARAAALRGVHPLKCEYA